MKANPIPWKEQITDEVKKIFQVDIENEHIYRKILNQFYDQTQDDISKTIKAHERREASNEREFGCATPLLNNKSSKLLPD